MSRDEHDRDAAAASSHLLFHLEAADTGQADIDDGAIGRTVLGQIRFPGFEQMHLVPVRAEGAAHRPPNVHVVIDDNQRQLGRTGSHVTLV